MSTDTDIGGWNATNDSNGTINGLNIAEGCPTANLNNAIRAVMGALARAYTGLSQFGGTDTGTLNAYVISPASPPVAYVNGMTFFFVASSANTGFASLAVTGVSGVLSARGIRNQNGKILSGGEILAGSLVEVVYLTSLNSGAGGWMLLSATLGSQAPVSGVVGGARNNVTSSRAIGSDYTNNNSKPIEVSICGYSNHANATLTLTAGGILIAESSQSAANFQMFVSGLILPGESYVAELSTGIFTIDSWMEIY